ncbi:MAG: carbohydrate deacetylase [Actinomycetes bacterium]
MNADDFGQCDGINRGILAAHERGVVTSASLMVRWDAASDASQAAERAGLPLGLHIDLGEWRFKRGEWSPVYEVVDLDDETAVAAEVGRQVDAFAELTGRRPAHIDSHQHVHRRQSVGRAVTAAAEQLGSTVRDSDPRVTYCGGFYGQTPEGSPLRDAISVDSLLGIIGALPVGITELGCHPGFDVEIDTMYRTERAQEVATLCDHRVRAALEAQRIRLCSFEEL